MATGTNPARGEHRVRIEVGGDGICRVKPGKLHVRRRDSVVFEAINTRARITFPEKFPFGRLRPNKVVNFESRSRKWPIKVLSNARPGEYEYSVYCEKTRRYAVGASLPRMIIDD